MDPDEFEFVEAIRRQESAQFLKMREEEQKELRAFQNAVQNPDVGETRKLKVKKIGGDLKLNEKPTQPPLKTSMRVKIVRKGTDDKATNAKRLKTDKCTEASGEGLGTFLGDYSSGSSD